MEKSIACISSEIFIMKKTLTGLVALLLIGVATKAQSEKEIKPPPPPKTIIDEKVKVKEPPVIAIKGNMIDEKAKVKEPPVITVKGKMADDFYKRNPSVAEISRQRNIITLKKQDGTIEKYDMSKKEEDKSFIEKYGESPIPPPPPPPKKEEQ
jgi:hypothetical protein